MVNYLNKKRIVYVIGVLLTLVGSSTFLYNYVNEKIDVAFEMMNEELFSESTQVSSEEVEETEIVTSVAEEIEEPTYVEANNNSEVIDGYYIGYLEIPKINVYRGFVDMNSEANNVKINIQIIKPSSYPDVVGGNFIIASHSGYGRNAYFRDLYQLTNGDLAYVHYNDDTYVYQISNIYLQPKVGSLSVYRNADKTTLTLITCTKDDETTQTVYIFDLINVE